MREKAAKSGQILLVDDHVGVCRMLCRVLNPPHSIKCASSVEEALVVFGDFHFDLVILDIDLGDGAPTGLDFLFAISGSNYHGVVCILSGYLSPDLLHEALLLGADDYLIKNNIIDIRREVERLLLLGRLSVDKRPQYKTIADMGLLRTLQFNADQIDILACMLEHDFPPDKILASEMGLGVKALCERVARIEMKIGANNRRQLVRYLTVLSGYVRRNQSVWGGGRSDRSFLVINATLLNKTFLKGYFAS